VTDPSADHIYKHRISLMIFDILTCATNVINMAILLPKYTDKLQNCTA